MDGAGAVSDRSDPPPVQSQPQKQLGPPGDDDSVEDASVSAPVPSSPAGITDFGPGTLDSSSSEIGAGVLLAEAPPLFGDLHGGDDGGVLLRQRPSASAASPTTLRISPVVSNSARNNSNRLFRSSAKPSFNSMPVSIIERIISTLRMLEKTSSTSTKDLNSKAALVSAATLPTSNPISAVSPTAIPALNSASQNEATLLEDASGPSTNDLPSTTLASGPLPASLHCLSVSRHVSSSTARALYLRPQLTSSRQFLSFLATCLQPDPLHPYPLLVRHLDLIPSVAADLDLGDLDIAFQILPNLAHLRVGPSPTATNVLLQSVADHLGDGGSGVAGLRRLEVRGCPVTDACVELVLKSCKGLKWLDLSESACSVGGVVEAIVTSGCANVLSTLKLVGVTGSWRPSSKVAAVRSGATTSPTPFGLRSIATDDFKSRTRVPLVHVDVSRALGMTDDDARLLLDVCGESVRVLVLSGCHLVSDESLARIARVCRKVRALDVSFLPTLSDWGISALGRRSFPSQSSGERDAMMLETLNISGCDLITPQGVLALLPKFSTQVLPTSRHGGSVGGTSVGMPLSSGDLQIGCPHLKELVMHGCAGILGSFVRRFATSSVVATTSIGAGAAVGSLECVVKNDGLRLLAAHGRGGWERIVEASVPSGGSSPRESTGSSVATKVNPEEKVELVESSVQTDESGLLEAAARAKDVDAAGAAASANPSGAVSTSASSAEALLLKFAAAMASGTWMPPGMSMPPPNSAMWATYWQQMAANSPAGTPTPPSNEAAAAAEPLNHNGTAKTPKAKRTPIIFDVPLSDADFTGGSSLLDLDIDPNSAYPTPPDFEDDIPPSDGKRFSILSSTSTGSDYSSASAMAAARRLRNTAPSRSGLVQARFGGSSGLPAPTPVRKGLNTAPGTGLPLPTAYKTPVSLGGTRPSGLPGKSGIMSPATLRKSISVARASGSSNTVGAASGGMPSRVGIPNGGATGGGYKPRQFKRYNADGVDAFLTPSPARVGTTINSTGSTSTNNPKPGGRSVGVTMYTPPRASAPARTETDEERLLREFAATLPEGFRRQGGPSSPGTVTSELSAARNRSVSTARKSVSYGAAVAGSGVPGTKKSLAASAGQVGTPGPRVSAATSSGGANGGWIAAGRVAVTTEDTGEGPSGVGAVTNPPRWSTASGSSGGSGGSGGSPSGTGVGSRLPMLARKSISVKRL
ncbi:hypothetical protein DFJ73DRAFT_221231 [Zopfochytrium polystomum]|nr:hypothetical protein DFJ73DRAFT_221231 [Zopfochytrium polystomum]